MATKTYHARILSDDFEPFVRTLLTMTDAQLKNLFNKYWLAWQDPCPTLPHDTFQAAPPASTHADKALTKEGIPAVAEVTMMCYEDYRREMPRLKQIANFCIGSGGIKSEGR